MSRCTGTKKNGQPCNGWAAKNGSGLCAPCSIRTIRAEAAPAAIDFADLPDETMLSEEAAPTPRVLDNLSETEAAAAQFAEQYKAGVSTPADVDEDVISQLAAGTARMEKIKHDELRDIQEADERQREEHRRARAEGRDPRPLRAHPVNTLEDRTLGMMTGPDGKLRFDPSVRHPRVVRLRDGENRINYGRASAFAATGYEPLLDAKTGKPVVSELGILMTCPIEQEAARKALAEKHHVQAAEDTEKQFVNSQNDGVYGRVVGSQEMERVLEKHGVR